MTIEIQGKEKIISICIEGEKCSVMERNGTGISMWLGTATVNTEDEKSKRRTIETTERYDKDGKLVEKITKEITKIIDESVHAESLMPETIIQQCQNINATFVPKSKNSTLPFRY